MSFEYPFCTSLSFNFKAVNNGDTVAATISSGTLFVTLKKSGDPYVIVANAQGKAIYRIHILASTSTNN